jgi:tRNA(adenine34) deaminase
MWEHLSLVWQACIEEAWEAYCARTMPIGAAIVGPDGAILARGRNRIAQPISQKGQLAGHPLAHAEINALIALEYSAVDPQACALYTTCEPCPLCLGAFYMSGLRRLVFACRDPLAGSTDLLGKTPYLSRKPIHLDGPDIDLEPLLMALQVDHELTHRQGLSLELLLDAWACSVPAGVELGRYIYAKHFLANLTHQEADAGAMIDCLQEVYLSARKG